MMLPANEVFRSIQGEGYHVGTPSLFIRLQGCDVGCPWCDTRESWSKKGMLILASESLDKLMAESPERHVVVTGGEPLIHDISIILEAAFRHNKSVQIETSGTAPIPDGVSLTWLTVSPKMRFNLPLIDSVVEAADELKMPVHVQRDVDDLVALIERVGYDGPVYLQPISQSRRATELCIEQAAKHGFRVSIQIHKYIGMQ